MQATLIEYNPDIVEAARASILCALEAGASRVVLALDHLDRLDAQAVRGLIILLRCARGAGGEIALQVSRKDLVRSLRVTALDRLFPLVELRGDAKGC
jgi:anti-anti-sigma regulatory factor